VAALIIYSLATKVWIWAPFVLGPLLALAVPWVIVRSRRFQMQVSSWRNIRFRFHGTYGGALAAYIGWGIVAVLTFYLMLPRLLYARVRFQLANTSFGTQRLTFEKKVGTYYRFFYLTLFYALCALAGAFIITMVVAAGLAFAPGATSTPVTGGLLGLMFFLGMSYVFLLLGAYFEKSFVNATFDGLGIGPHRLRCQVQMKRLLYLYVTNVLGVLFSLGLAYPWALVRRLKYQLESMSVETQGSLDGFLAASDPATSATGEELGEFFDVDFGF
jgi:uncharacterized membrane protein YjgN (DUF898 family)